MRKPSVVLLLILLINLGAAAGWPVHAQNGANLSLSALRTDTFPANSAMLDIYDAAGDFVSGLKPEDLTVLEDGQPRPLTMLEELLPGVQFVVAINAGPALASRDVFAVSRYEKLARALEEWAANRPAEAKDILGLVPHGGLNASRQTAPGFLSALSAYKIDMRTITPTLDTLSTAIDMAAETTSEPAMKRAVLLVTPLPESAALPTLQSISARAVELKVRVYVWIVASADYFVNSGATALKDLAIQTGGKYFLFSGDEVIPSPESYLAPLRHIYTLTYSSGITTPGSHSLEAQLGIDGQTFNSAPLSFDLDVQPPNPVLVSPPEQIVRQILNPQETSLSALQPAEQPIEILVEFPDGHNRPLTRTALYVDGQIVMENTAEPFGQFTWDLGGYTSSGVHNLQVEAEDGLGLGKISLTFPVTVTVVKPQTDLRMILGRNAAWIVGGAILMAGAILAGILTAGSRRRHSSTSEAGPGRGLGRKSRYDPLTQPVMPQEQKSRWQFPWRRSPGTVSPAYLVRLKPDGQPITAPPIPLTGEEVTFGNDPTKATSILNDPSISPLHARLAQDTDGTFILSDEKSIAGTWVNYEPIQEPRRLQHGDLIYIGLVAYRFMLRKPPEMTSPKLTTEKQ